MCGFDGIQRCNYFGRELIRGTEVEVRVKKFKNGKAVGNVEVTEQMVKGGVNVVVYWI